MIEEFYGDRKATRSGVPLINHINEGTNLLRAMQASPCAIEAFRLHPMFQEDKELEDNFHELLNLEPRVVSYIMEYRNIANYSLSDIVYRDYSTDWCPLALKRPIKISPLDQVNLMLIADKVQNWKDFKQYHLGKHARSDELDFYFRSWFRALEISEDTVLHMEANL